MKIQFSQLHIAQSEKNKEFQNDLNEDQKRRLFDFKLRMDNLLYLAQVNEKKLNRLL